MTFCGYNETMAKGLRLFVDGMIEALEQRHCKGAPMQQVVSSELIDLRNMNRVLERDSGKDATIDAFVAINLFAQAVFRASDAQTASCFSASCRDFGAAFIALVKQTEEKHVAELAQRNTTAGDPDVIEDVARWLLQQRQLSHAAE